MGDYSEELVELVAQKLAEIYAAPWQALSAMGRSVLLVDARKILAAIPAGRLVPEGSEKEWRCADLGGMGHVGRAAEADLRRHGDVSGHTIEFRVLGPWTPAEPAQEEKP